MRRQRFQGLIAMAEVILKNIKKVYPHQEPKKKKKGEPEKKTNLQITEEGVLAVDNFNLHPAAASPPPCGWWPVWRRSPAASCTSAAS